MAAKAFMQQGNYASAKPHLKSIIDSGKFSMQSDYAEIFMESNDNGPHVVFLNMTRPLRVWEMPNLSKF